MQRLFDAIPSVLEGIDPNLDTPEALAFAAWNRCSGDLLRRRTAAIRFRKKRLVVAVEDATWQRHLEDLSPQMLAKLNALLGSGKVNFIEFAIAPDILSKSRISPVSKEFSNIDHDEISPSLTKAAESITDKGLRDQFLSTAASYLAEKYK